MTQQTKDVENEEANKSNRQRDMNPQSLVHRACVLPLCYTLRPALEGLNEHHIYTKKSSLFYSKLYTQMPNQRRAEWQMQFC